MIFLINQIPLFIFIILSSLGTIIGDIFGKLWSINQKPSFFIFAGVFYSIAGFLFLPSLFKESLVISSILWSLLSTTGFIVVGIFIFHEHLDVIQSIGLFFGLMALLIFALRH